MGEADIISTRLKALRTELKLSQKAFGTKIGIAQTSYANYEGGKSSVPSNVLEQIAKSTGVNLNWLITGAESMFTSQASDSAAGNCGSASDSEKAAAIYDRFDKCTQLIPMTDLSVSAGTGVDWGSGEYTGELMPIPKDIYIRYRSYDLAGARVKGDSMEPTLKDGEPVVYARGAIEGDGIYVISILDELFVKRLSRNILDQTVTIISDNTLYPPIVYSMDREGLEILGKVVFWLHMEK